MFLNIEYISILLCGPGYRIGPPCSLLMCVVKGDERRIKLCSVCEHISNYKQCVNHARSRLLDLW